LGAGLALVPVFGLVWKLSVHRQTAGRPQTIAATKRVLVVDDDIYTRPAVGKSRVLEGYAVETAGNGWRR
jgi:hypothetical protein